MRSIVRVVSLANPVLRIIQYVLRICTVAITVALFACDGSSGVNSSVPAATTPKLRVIALSQDPVLVRGAAGAWDDTDVLNPSVISFNGTLVNHYSGFSQGLWSTGSATSTDGGATWSKAPEPFLVSPPVSAVVPEPIAANGASVVFNGKLLHLYARSRSATDRRVSIWLATSSDGTAWDTSAGEVFTASGVAGTFDEDQVSDPFVIEVGGTLYLYYTGAPTGLFRVLLGVATSRDGAHWNRVAGPLIAQGRPGMFDEFIQGEPSVVYTGKYWYMLYVGDRNDGLRSLGWASSFDGINWQRQSTTDSIVPLALRPAWCISMMIDPHIVPQRNQDGTYDVYFGGGVRPGNQRIVGQIGRMTVSLD